jgi:hypothetical protein
VEQADVPAAAKLLEKLGQRAGAFRKLESAQPLIANIRRASTDHVANVQLRHLVVGEVGRLVTSRIELTRQRETIVA